MCALFPEIIFDMRIICLTKSPHSVVVLDDGKTIWTSDVHNYVLQENHKEQENLTARGLLWTISTAWSLLRCSHKPSDANIRKESFGWIGWEITVGLADKKGMFIGSGSLNFALMGSRLNCSCFIYTSPIDLETCTK